MGLPSFFTEKEIACKCGCGHCIIQPLFYFKMNVLRALIDRPLRITSWNRCDEHNIKEGGSDTSSHLIGYAADIFTSTPFLQYIIVFYAGRIGFRGVGIGDNFVHLDDDIGKNRDRFWTY